MNRETKHEKSTNKMSIMKRWIIALIFLICGLFMAACTDAMANTHSDEYKVDTQNIELIDSQIHENFILPHDSIRIEMINQVQSYLTKSTRGKADSKLAEYLVDNALEHDIDICFIMSQTKIETCFGTAGVGRSSSRRSLFGVIKKKYSSYDDAINDYCKILKRSYLVKGRTEHDLMRRYVTKGGARYASNPNYERELSAEYKKIAKLTNLTNLQASYKVEYLAYETSLKKSSIIENDSVNDEISAINA